jgi:hypothetical protein
LREHVHGAGPKQLLTYSHNNQHHVAVSQDPTVQLDGSHANDPGSAARQLGKQLRDIAERRVWLPRAIYESLPFVYIVVGCLALLSTVYNRHWSWLVPHVFLFGCFLVHLGLMVRRRRIRARSAAGRTAN